MKTTLVLAAFVLFGGVVAPCAYAQKGMGDAIGIAQRAKKPKIVSLSGKVLSTKTGPCEKTTGPSEFGTHLLMKTPDGKTLNIHLGPAGAVDFIADRLTPGKKVTVRAFRTSKMPKNQYVAQSVAFGKTKIVLRDKELRPFWARGDGSGWGRGRGDGAGRGRGRGRGWGQGYRRGRGRGYQRGWGRGWGWR